MNRCVWILALVASAAASAQSSIRLLPAVDAQPVRFDAAPVSGGGCAGTILAEGVAEPAHVRLFEAARPLLAPGEYRAEAWVRMGGAACRIDVVLRDAESGAETARLTVADSAFPPPADPLGRYAGRQYGACEFRLDVGTMPVTCAIEAEVRGGNVVLEDVRVSGADSILANGAFADTEPGEPGLPRCWRRHYEAADTTQAQGFFTVQQGSEGNVLEVVKGAGSFVLSGEPMEAPRDAGAFVVWLRADETSLPIPSPVLRQYGRGGILREDAALGGGSLGGECVLPTGPCERSADAERLVLLVRFPEEAGTWRLRSVEVLPFMSRKPPVQVLVNQAGYDAHAPLRFVVASPSFPVNGLGTFRMEGSSGAFGGALLPVGRATGQGGGDWGSYYFEGVAMDPPPGAYTLSVSLSGEVAATREVTVDEDRLLRATGEDAYRFYFVQRCGYAVPGWHGLCHLDDGKLPDGSHADVTGGYHNAGDFHKHMGDNTPISVYAMATAYERYPAFFDARDTDANGRADILDEAVWGAEWMLKMCDAATGRIWINVTNDIDYYGVPELDTDGIAGTGDDRVINTNDPGDLGASVIAAWAVLARHVNDPRYLGMAQRAWAVYETRACDGHDPRHVLAALELLRTTGAEAYGEAAERVARNLLDLQDAAGWFAGGPGTGPVLRIVDEGTIPAALARFVLARPDAEAAASIKEALRRYFAWSFRMADNPFGLVRSCSGGEPFFFKAREDWFGGANSQYASTAWAARVAAAVFADDPEFASRLRAHAAAQFDWILGANPLDLCMFEGAGNSSRIRFHHNYASIAGHARGDVPGAIPNGITREPGNTDRPWFDLREDSGAGAPPAAESSEPWLPHNAYYLLALAAD